MKRAPKAGGKPLNPKPNDMDLDDDDLDIEERAQKELDDVTAAAKNRNSSETYQKVCLAPTSQKKIANG